MPGSKTANISLKTKTLPNFKKCMFLSLKNRKVKFSTEGLSPKSLAKIENPVITGLMNPVIAKLVKSHFQKIGHSVTNRVNEPHSNRVKKSF